MPPSRAKPANMDMSLDEIISKDGTVRVAKRIYVGNMAYGTNWQALKDHFKCIGHVVYCNVLADPRSASKRSLGSGIVEFETPDDAAEAIRTMHDSLLDGRPLVVREDRDDRDLQAGAMSQTVEVKIGHRGNNGSEIIAKDRGRPPVKERSQIAKDSGNVRVGKRVYVGNLAYSTTWQMLKDHFRPVGKVVYANVMEEAPGRSKGCGIVEFDTPEDAAAAIKELHDSKLNGRLLIVREDREDKDMKNSVPVTSSRGASPRPRPSRKRKRDESSEDSSSCSRRSCSRRSCSRKSSSSSSSECENGSREVRVARRVYVGNLEFDTTWQELKDHFRQAGAVVYANVIGKSGSGIVEFERPEQARYAIERLFDSKLNGRKLIVREDREDRDLLQGGKRGTVLARTKEQRGASEDRPKRRRTY